MNTLVIYDNSGVVIQTASGNVLEPNGVPFLWAEVPEGKRVASVDISGDVHIVVFEDLPKTQADEINELKQSMLELSMIVAGGAL